MNNKHIALVGLPGSGKSTLLTALACQRSGVPNTPETAKFIAIRQDMLNSGNWKDWTATDPGDKAAELEFKLSFRERKYVILKSRDYSGEKWDDFINSDNRKNDISKYLKSANAVAICFDLSIDNKETDYKQRYLVNNIYNFLKPNFLKPCKLGLIITKWDAVEDHVNANGGLEKVLKSKLGPEIIDYLKKKNRIFPVSAREFEFNPDTETDSPIPGSQATGLGALENWLYGSQIRIMKVKNKGILLLTELFPKKKENNI